MGERFQSLRYFRLGITIAEIVIETCKINWEELAPLYMKKPTVDEWTQVADTFSTLGIITLFSCH